MLNYSLTRRLFALFLSLIVVLTISASTATAQTTTFTYQSTLTDGASPANGIYDFEFKLFDTPDVGTGTQQGSTVQRLSVSVTNGSFTLQLDFGACSTCFNGANRYIEISVRPSGASTFTTLSPRQQITSTPYSIKSASAASADGLSAFCVSCVTSSQIGSVNAGALTGTLPVSSIPAGSANYIQNTTTLQPSSNFNISGNGVVGGALGIGTNPASLLHVKGANPVRILGDTTTLSGSEFVDFFARSSIFSSDLGGMRIQRNATTGAIDTLVFAAASGTSASEKMRIAGNGNVGIGTDSPDRDLTVSSPGGAYINVRDRSFIGGGAEVLLGADGNGGILSTMSNDDLQLRAGLNSIKMIIKANGNVGIGTINPSARLDVVGTTTTQVLQITGGIDLSEQFEVKAAPDSDSPVLAGQIEPGMVVSIDTGRPGKLVVSSLAYDRRVAGIISGAGGIRPGVLLSQAGWVADGGHPVALTGRVYCWADASRGTIKPGDLLTTSQTPGHVMRVANYSKSKGAIVGKAMTGLKRGRGLVLVLVSLQ